MVRLAGRLRWNGMSVSHLYVTIHQHHRTPQRPCRDNDLFGLYSYPSGGTARTSQGFVYVTLRAFRCPFSFNTNCCLAIHASKYNLLYSEAFHELSTGLSCLWKPTHRRPSLTSRPASEMTLSTEMLLPSSILGSFACGITKFPGPLEEGLVAMIVT